MFGEGSQKPQGHRSRFQKMPPESLKYRWHSDDYKRRFLFMSIMAQVGETAGQVWRLLSSEGPQTMAQLKKKLDPKGEMLGMALGWLAREDKIEFLTEKKTVLVQLK
jgi:hypothetical protein